MRDFARSWFVASAAAAVIAMAFAVDARAAQMQPAGSVPYQSNNHPAYRTTTSIAGHITPNGAIAPSPSFACRPSPMGTQAVRNPGTAGPTLSGNNNNCARSASPGTGVTGPH
jgi:hypothetical protein